MARQSKSLTAHIRDRTFRAGTHGKLLDGPDLPVTPPHPNPTPAMGRLWARLRELQTEHRDLTATELKYDIRRDFGRVANEYMDAVSYSRMRPEDDIAGIREIMAVHREARRRWEAEQASSD